jgi:hypothetical protein
MPPSLICLCQTVRASIKKRNTREVQELADYGCATTMHLLEINAERLDDENNSREYDFSPATIDARWRAGYADTCRVIARRPWLLGEHVDQRANDARRTLCLAAGP